jgi:hypothetical protein
MNEELESYFGHSTESLLNLHWLLGPKDASENWSGCTRFCLWRLFEISRHYYSPETRRKQAFAIKSNRDHDSKIVTYFWNRGVQIQIEFPPLVRWLFGEACSGSGTRTEYHIHQARKRTI